MDKNLFNQRYFSIPDFAILLLLATVIYGVFSIANEWRADYHPISAIDLSFWSLPYYTLLSAIRGVVAYFISLVFTLVVGYAAAKSKSAEKVIIPLLDILQSIPVLGFLPGLILGLVNLFPRTNTGLELAAIIMIFTGQVWNMTFSYYSSLKSIPTDLLEASTVMGLSRRQKLLKMELPFSAVNLAWNSLLSMAGGWFFLIACEAFTLGDKEYRLPGIGSYMDSAVKSGNTNATIMAVIAMTTLIVSMDFVIWRPILSWVQKYRLDQVAGGSPTAPLMQIWIRESKLVRWITLSYRDFMGEKRAQLKRKRYWIGNWIGNRIPKLEILILELRKKWHSPRLLKALEIIGILAVFGFVGYGAFKLLMVLLLVPFSTWIILLRDTLFTFLRVLLALAISTLWAVPVGIWIGTSNKRTRIAQPLIQVLASFPTPMLYPVLLSLFYALNINFDIGSMFLMLMGVQWYVLFNVLAGAMRIPQELVYALSLMEASRWDRWKTLYLPSVFPLLVTGWITAAGGAWNASVLAEYVTYRGKILKTAGLGATLSVATENGNFPLFAASLTVMVSVVILLNRTVWSRVYHLAQTRYRMEV